MSVNLTDAVPSHLSVSSPAPLGTIAKFVSTQEQSERKLSALRARYALQDTARKLLPKERVSQCRRMVMPQTPGVEIWANLQSQIARYRNLMVCGSVWVCPVCAVNISEERRHDLDAGVTEAVRRGWSVYLETFTFRHKFRDGLKPMLDAALAARRAALQGRAYDDLQCSAHVVGRVTATEVTRGANGWHPHFHSLVFFLPGGDPARYAEWMSTRWLQVLDRKGLSGNGHAYRFDRTFGAVGDYVAKFGRDPEKEPWGVSAELVKWHTKTGRMSGSMTPFQLLEAAPEVPPAARAFREYAEAFKGRHQLQWSPYLRRALIPDRKEISDQEAANASGDVSMEIVAQLDRSVWKTVLANGARAEVLHAAATSGLRGVYQVLVDIGVDVGLEPVWD